MTAITVTAAESGTTFPGVLLQVMVLTGVAASPIGNTATQSGASAHQASITITGAGSQVYAVAANVGTGGFSPNGQTTTLTDQADSPNGLETVTGRTTSATSGAGPLIVGWGGLTGAGSCALLEILPAGTITEDASSPAGIYSGSGSTTVTTASFDPQAGCTLVAMVGADASTSTVITVSDSSSLTWTQQVVSQVTGNLYSGVWTAQIPAPPSSPPAVLYSMRMMP